MHIYVHLVQSFATTCALEDLLFADHRCVKVVAVYTKCSDKEASFLGREGAETAARSDVELEEVVVVVAAE